MRDLKKYRTIMIVVLITVLPQLNVWAKQEQSPILDPQDTVTIFLPLISTGNNSTPITTEIYIDHNSIALFDQIPDQYIFAASQITMLFRHASVGYNISYSLDCLGNNYVPRVPGCDRGVPPGEVVFDDKYNRDNWLFEFHLPPPAQNPGWWEKVSFFINRVDNLAYSEDYDVVGYKHGYVDAYAGSQIDDLFFTSDPGPYMGINDLEALEARHPDKTIVLWTMGLAKLKLSRFRKFQSTNAKLRDHP